MPLSTTPAEYDLAIVGGGLVGASLALSLAPLGLRIALVEAVSPVQGEQHPSFDERTTALANGTVRAFRTLGVWAGMEREAAPIRKIHVSDQGRFGSARIDAAEQGLEALGYVVPNRAIGAALWHGLSRAPSVEVIAPARVTGSEPEVESRVVHYEVAGEAHSLRARLVVAADGIRSLVRDHFRLGRFLRIGQRASYNLMLSRADRHVAQRLAVVGNAAQGLHPIAGQGFNLGLRDAMSLAEVIADRRVAGTMDPGDANLLQDYADWRESDRRRIVAFTDGLVRLFATPLGVLRSLRSLGILAFDVLPPAKSALARLSVGASERVPRLARGVPLAGTG
ncbi:MAG: FAD-dependent monooxygenase [Proteobacteria bacterium]|nr:FAD-dependent monooxygenase [Pseudomonadota bacterium]